jgi:beta-lactamase regulating signal transducer with metallopeptidase domain
MDATLIYIWKASWVLAIFFVAYRLLLKKETFFLWNRLFLLLGIGASFLVPFLHYTKYIELVPTTYNAITPTSAGFQRVTDSSNQMGMGFDTLLVLLYGLGVLFFITKFILQLTSLKKFIRQGIHEHKGHFVFVATNSHVTPFSFFKYIVFNPQLYQKSELTSIISHEKVHCSQWHSVDIVLANLTQILFWFHPISWLYKNDIQQNLEFLADAGASKNIPCLKTYEYALLKVSGNQLCTSITNNFYNSLIKKRIVMLHRSKSNKQNVWKYLTIVPMLFIFIFLFNTQVIAQNAKKIELDIKKIEIVIDKNSDSGTMDKDRDFLKERGVALKVKKLKRNSEGEITAIRIEVNSAQSNAQYETNGDTPIQPIKISIDGDGKNISIGNATHQPDNEFQVAFHDDDSHSSASSGHKTIHVKKMVDDENTDGKEEKIVIRSADDDMVWTSEGDEDLQEIKIENVNGKETITVNGKEVTPEELDEIKSEEKEGKKIKIIRKHKEEDGNKQIMILKDSDDESDIEIIDKDQSGFFFLDTEAGEIPLFFIDNMEATSEAVKKLSPKEIESIDIVNGEPAIKEYGPKAKDGVIKITTKKN